MNNKITAPVAETFVVNTLEFRSMPVPAANGQSMAKQGNCFVCLSDIPKTLNNWMDVNPRKPQINKNGKLNGRVGKRLTETIVNTPDLFVLKNQGITVLAESVSFSKQKGGVGELEIVLSNPLIHGVVNGGHTLRAIQEVNDDADLAAPDSAFVSLTVLTDVDSDNIVEVAEGLNRSLQVNEASLDNLEGRFDGIKAAMVGKHGESQISYSMGDLGEMDVEQVLFLMKLLDLKDFPDAMKHPNTIFGQPAKVLKAFAADTDPAQWGDYSSAAILIPKVHEILQLWEQLYHLAVQGKPSRLGLLGRKKDKNVAALKPFPAPFTDGLMIDRKALGAGLLYPMFAAMRANINETKWSVGQLVWNHDPKTILDATIDPMCQIVKDGYNAAKGKPAEVGKNPSVYQTCYQHVLIDIMKRK
jgi:hypothetical protein